MVYGYNMLEKKMTRYSSVTLGCKLNYAETSTYERRLSAAGWESAPWSDKNIDWYLVNTCSVTEHSDKKSRNIIRKLHRICPDAKIVVTGCSAQLRKDEIEKIEGVVRVFGADEKSQVAEYMIDFENARRKFSSICPEECCMSCPDNYFNAWSSGERTRSFLKVQDGCDFKCAYCTVPYARGESRNAPISTIVDNARKIASEGIKEIVLTGVNTGDFGKSTGESFLALLKELDKIEGIERYRISSIEPNLLTEEIVRWIASGTKFLPHFHIPLQCGCDAILENMGRRYRCAEFADKIRLIRDVMEKPGRQKVFFGIDVIVGFPGEGEEEFEECYRFLSEEIKPAFLHIFPYSKRPGTPAASMKNQVQDSIKTERVERLEKLSEKLHAEFIEANRGLPSKVLFEECDGSGMVHGWSENYLKISIKGGKEKINTIEEVEL